MSGNESSVTKKLIRTVLFVGLIATAGISTIFLVNAQKESNVTHVVLPNLKLPDSSQSVNKVITSFQAKTDTASDNKLDTVLYNQYITHLTNGDSSGHWPVRSAYPGAGAILPFKRVVAFYGNLYSKKMGILGELPPKEMLEKLQAEMVKWQLADTTMEVVPALHYIAITAQVTPGKAGKYRLRMPDHQVDLVMAIAKKIDALVFLDIQVGLSTLEEEIPSLEKYLLMPNVHLGIDPEFSMKTGKTPGKKVGSFDAADVNYASNYLSDLVTKNNLPPKMLVVHRFTQGMLTNYKQINTIPRVQVVIDMDGWGTQALKINAYKQFLYKEPVQFTGFKLFYKNDTKANGNLLTPTQLLKLKPQPVYIQYQ